MKRPDFHILVAETPDQYRVGRELFSTYIDSLDFNIEFQDYTSELAQINTMYNHPDGALLLADQNSRFVGCAGVRRLTQTTCELKRTYVFPECRGQGIGRALLEASLKIAKELGYQKMYLDTHFKMIEAISLYEQYGFKEIAPYYHNPIKETKYFSIAL